MQMLGNVFHIRCSACDSSDLRTLGPQAFFASHVSGHEVCSIAWRVTCMPSIATSICPLISST